MHLDSEVTIFSPIGSPWISSDPVFYSILDSPPNNTNFVGNYWWLIQLLAEDTIFIQIEFLGSLNTTRNRSSAVYFQFHSISSRKSSILTHVPLVNLFSNGVAVIGSIDGWWSGWNTVHTILDVWAWEVGWVSGCVLLTSSFRDSVFIGKLIDINWFSSITWSSSITVYDNLRSESQLWPLVVSLDINSISKSWGGSLSPARSTIYWNVLVDTPTQIVDTVKVTPIPFFGESVYINVIFRLWSLQQLDFFIG